jgi:hypothetical protein
MWILQNPKKATRVLIVSVVCSWLAAAVLAELLPPQLIVQPAVAETAGDSRPSSAHSR